MVQQAQVSSLTVSLQKASRKTSYEVASLHGIPAQVLQLLYEQPHVQGGYSSPSSGAPSLPAYYLADKVGLWWLLPKRQLL